VALGTAWTNRKMEMSDESHHLLTKWAIYSSLTLVLLLVVPGLLAYFGVIPSTPAIVAGGALPTSVTLLWWFLWLIKEWQKVNPQAPKR